MGGGLLFLCYLLVGGGLVGSWVKAQQGPTTIDYLISEEMPAYSLIGNIAVDAGLNLRYPQETLNKLTYRVLSQANQGKPYLHIQEHTGIIQTAQVIDRDKICPEKPKCYIQLDVAIGPRDYFQVVTIKTEIQDLNDNAPSFGQAELTHHISESTAPGTSIGIPAAEDPDSKDFAIQRYELLPDTQTAFNLKVTHILDGSTDLQLVTLKQLDREEQDSYQLQVVAYDGGDPQRSGSILVNIKIDDTNDNHPKFDYEAYEIDVFEDTEAGTTIANVVAHDADTGANGEVTYSFTKKTHSAYGKTFGIEPTSGAIYLKHRLDFETNDIYHLVAVASDSGPDSHQAHATVIVKVKDVNDSPPKIMLNTLTDSGEAEISEASKIETFVAHVSAVDKDSGKNGEVSCSLDSEKFKLEKMYKDQYKIVTAADFDRETQDSYVIQLECEDGGEMPLRSSEEVRVRVLDANDHVPKFHTSTYQAAVDENNFITSFVVAVSATDGDIGANGRVLFRIDHEEAKSLFDLEEHTGVIRAAVEFDHEKINSIQFPVVAYDSGKPSLSSTATVLVTIRDVNDCPPVFSQEAYSFGIHENKKPGTEVGNVAASDADSPPFNKVEYFLDADDLDAIESFSINHITGQITTRKKLDREIHSMYYLRVKAINEDYTPLSSSVSVTVYVADQNDNSPVLDFPVPYNNTIRMSSFAPIGYDVIRVRAHDEDIGVNSEIEYTMSDDYEKFEIDSVTGAIQTTADLSTILYHQFNISVKASDKGQPRRSDSNMLYIIVTDAIPYYVKSPQTDETPLFSSKSTIVIGVACGSIIVIIVLLCAIIIIKCSDRRQPKPSGSYNCRVEAQKMLNKDPNADVHDEHSPKHRLMAKENTYNDPNHGHHYATLPAQQNAKANHETLPRQASFQQEPHNNTMRSNKGTLSRPGQEKEMEVHKVLEYLRRRQDDDGDTSTADSGRGTTVEEDVDINNIYNGSYTSFSSNLNDRDVPHTITIESKKPPNAYASSPSAPKLSTFAPPAPSTPGSDGEGNHPTQGPQNRTLPHPNRSRIIKVDDPCGCHGNIPVAKASPQADSGYGGEGKYETVTVLPANSTRFGGEDTDNDLMKKFNDASLKDSVV